MLEDTPEHKAKAAIFKALAFIDPTITPDKISYRPFEPAPVEKRTAASLAGQRESGMRTTRNGLVIAAGSIGDDNYSALAEAIRDATGIVASYGPDGVNFFGSMDDLAKVNGNPLFMLTVQTKAKPINRGKA